jgi:hydrogenase-4 component F
MALIAFILVPLGFALAALVTPSERARPLLLPAAALVHAVFAAYLVAGGAGEDAQAWLALDAPGKVMLLVIEGVFAACSVYAVSYLWLRSELKNRVFVAAMLGLLGMMSLVVTAHHLGLLWVGAEAMTLTAAPMLYFNHNARSIEATWKYLVIGSVGIALALFGSFFLGYAALHAGLPSSLLFTDLVRNAPLLSRPWLHAGVVFTLVGYGTKMGLAPMHTWKPDVYGEVPGLVGALLAGGVTSCAFLAILRIMQIDFAAGDGDFGRSLLVFIGLFSMAVAAVFMVRQRDFKRMLAYSSVEHMGILALGAGLGGLALFGSLLHVINNALAKGVLFLSAGNIHRDYQAKHIPGVRGAFTRIPFSTALFVIGFLAVTGSPPFGPFVSEFTIISAAFGAERYGVGAAMLGLMAVIFIGMGTTVFAVAQGTPPEDLPPHRPEGWLNLAPLVVLLGIVLLLGLWLPQPLGDLLREAAHTIEGQP